MVKYPPAALNRTFAALADPTRRRILAQLAQGDRCVTRLARRHAMSLPAVSKHLRVEPARIIQARSSDRDKLRDRVRLDRNRRATFRAKAPMRLATRLTGRGMEAQ